MSLSQFFNDLLLIAVKAGIKINEYWELTLYEINTYISIYNDKQKDRQKEILASNYNVATLISSFINKSLNGKEIPPIYEIYPDLFERPEFDVAAYQQQFMQYALEVNRKADLK